MSKSLFASTVIDKVSSAIGRDGANYNESSASLAMNAIAHGITEYLMQNTEVIIQYTGTIPAVSPIPDPVVVDTFKIVGTCAPTGPSNSFDDWIKKLESNIISGFQLAPSGNAGVVFPQKPFLNVGIPITQANISSVYDISDEDPQQKVWEVICGGIMDWINTIAFNPTPSAATRPSGPSAGTALITKIIIS